MLRTPGPLTLGRPAPYASPAVVCRRAGWPGLESDVPGFSSQFYQLHNLWVSKILLCKSGDVHASLFLEDWKLSWVVWIKYLVQSLMHSKYVFDIWIISPVLLPQDHFSIPFCEFGQFSHLWTSSSSAVKWHHQWISYTFFFLKTT